MSKSKCSIDHEAAKHDEKIWASFCLLGIQVFDDPDEPEAVTERYELRNCSCGSTLCRRIA